MYGIKINYSWGDEEELYGNYETEEEAYKEMCKLACKEAYVQNEEFEEYRTCTINFDAYNKEIDLHYDCDEEVCYYTIEEK